MLLTRAAANRSATAAAVWPASPRAGKSCSFGGRKGTNWTGTSCAQIPATGSAGEVKSTSLTLVGWRVEWHEQ